MCYWLHLRHSVCVRALVRVFEKEICTLWPSDFLLLIRCAYTRAFFLLSFSRSLIFVLYQETWRNRFNHVCIMTTDCICLFSVNHFVSIVSTHAHTLPFSVSLILSAVGRIFILLLYAENDTLHYDGTFCSLSFSQNKGIHEWNFSATSVRGVR